MEDGWSARCVGCGQALTEEYRDPDVPCSGCGSTVRAFSVAIDETATARDWSREKGYGLDASGKQRLLFDTRRFPDVVRSRGDAPAQREMTIDKVRDRYTEVVTLLDTGEVIHRCDEPLSSHTGHGTARPAKKA
jgi:hypothetical protein